MKQLIKNIFMFGSLFTVGGALLLLALFGYFSLGLPKIDSLSDYTPSLPSEILAKDGSVLARLGKEEREIVPFGEIPTKVVNAFLAAEDDNFYEHSGVDYLGLIRATLANIRAGKVVQGGSTITQQVAKSFLLSKERSISRKIKDFILAQRIEEKLSKEDILFLYLNQVYLGGGYYGVKTAFKGYFGKELSEATVAEAAMVAGLLVAPGRYSPYLNPKYAKQRQNYVLGRLLATDKITKDEYEQAMSEKIKYRLRQGNEFKAGYFTEWIRQKVTDVVGEDEFLRGGYKVQTTLDASLQDVAEREVRKGSIEIDRRQGYKGNLGSVELEKLDELNMERRKKAYEEKSLFFTLGDESTRVYELEFNPEEYEKIKQHRNEFDEKIKEKKVKVLPGNMKDDPYFSVIEKEKIYQAVVVGVNNEARLVYIDLDGLIGIIPYDNFKWAHERQIEVDHSFLPYVTRPSSILREGNQILVQVKDKSVALHEHVTTVFKNKLTTSKDFALFKKERYLLCELYQEPEAQAALVSMRPETGEIVSLVGGVDFVKSKFNRAIQSKRQPGSSFKPILFAAGLENGFNPASIIIDSPEALGGVDATINWKPRNYDGKFKGPITYRNSLEQSRNVPMIKIANEMGVKKITEFTKRIGFNAELDPDLSLALGSFGVTLMDIVSTYAIFPNGGKKIEPKAIVSVVDRYGNEVSLTPKSEELTEEQVKDDKIIQEMKSNAQNIEGVEDLVKLPKEEKEKQNPFHEALGGDQVYDKRLAYIMTNLLRGVILHGTGQAAKSISTFLGGKTGTTNNYVDAWFLGFSPDIVTGVWTGMDDNTTMGWGETGAKSALPIWIGFMNEGKSRFGEKDFSQPDGVVNVRIDKETGKLSANGEGFLEVFVEGYEPSGEEVENELTDSLLVPDSGKGLEGEDQPEVVKKAPGKEVLSEDDYYENQ